MYSNVTENLNRPLCGGMAYASGFSVAVNELCEPTGGHLLHIYIYRLLVRAHRNSGHFFIIRNYPEIRCSWHCEMAIAPLTTAASMPFVVCIEHSGHAQNTLKNEVYLMLNSVVIAVYCENTQVHCTAKSRVSYCYSRWYVWLAHVSGAVGTIFP